MQTWGEGVEKSENFVDVISGSPLATAAAKHIARDRVPSLPPTRAITALSSCTGGNWGGHANKCGCEYQDSGAEYKSSGKFMHHVTCGDPLHRDPVADRCRHKKFANRPLTVHTGFFCSSFHKGPVRLMENCTSFFSSKMVNNQWRQLMRGNARREGHKWLE